VDYITELCELCAYQLWFFGHNDGGGLVCKYGANLPQIDYSVTIPASGVVNTTSLVSVVCLGKNNQNQAAPSYIVFCEYAKCDSTVLATPTALATIASSAATATASTTVAVLSVTAATTTTATATATATVTAVTAAATATASTAAATITASTVAATAATTIVVVGTIDAAKDGTSATLATDESGIIEGKIIAIYDHNAR